MLGIDVANFDSLAADCEQDAKKECVSSRVQWLWNVSLATMAFEWTNSTRDLAAGQVGVAGAAANYQMTS